MGRKAKPDLERYNVKLPSDLVERLDAQATKDGRSRSDLLAEAAELYLQRAARKRSRPSKK